MFGFEDKREVKCTCSERLKLIESQLDKLSARTIKHEGEIVALVTDYDVLRDKVLRKIQIRSNPAPQDSPQIPQTIQRRILGGKAHGYSSPQTSGQ